MNPSDYHIETPTAYSRESVVAYLQAAETEQARIRRSIADANARAGRAREKIASLAQAARDKDRELRLGVLQVEATQAEANGAQQLPTGPPTQPVFDDPVAPIDPVTVGSGPTSVGSSDGWTPQLHAEGPLDPFPFRSVSPISVPDRTQPVARWSDDNRDDPTSPWGVTAPVGRVAGD
jgi:hypothetical protein